jgi:hypothetical protein
MSNNENVLLSLENIVANKEKINFTKTYVDVSYFDKLEDEGRNWGGPRGWYGPGVNKAPFESTRYKLSIDVPISKVDSIDKILSCIEFTKLNPKEYLRRYLDNGLAYTFTSKVTSRKVIQHPEKIVKKPWFNELLKFMKEKDPTYDEAKLLAIDDSCDYIRCNDSAAEIQHAYNETVVTYDEKMNTLELQVMNDDVPAYSNIINSFLGVLFNYLQ